MPPSEEISPLTLLILNSLGQSGRSVGTSEAQKEMGPSYFTSWDHSETHQGDRRAPGVSQHRLAAV